MMTEEIAVKTIWISKTLKTMYPTPLSLFFFPFAMLTVILPSCYPHVLKKNSKKKYREAIY